MFERLRKMQDLEAEPNLIPVMNLFVAMIPFLLLAVAFFQLGIIPTTLPTHTENTSDVETSRQAITVSLVINNDGFSLSAMNQSLPEAELASLNRQIPKESGQYDYATLAETLQSYKQRYPRSDTVIVLPSERITYGELVRVMDKARYREEVETGGRKRQIPLFPNVVLSRTREQ